MYDVCINVLYIGFCDDVKTKNQKKTIINPIL